jgi:hypothetical protein
MGHIINDCCRCHVTPVLRSRKGSDEQSRYFYCPECEFVARYRFDAQSEDDALLVKDWNKANPSKRTLKSLEQIAKPVCTYCESSFTVFAIDEEEYAWFCNCSNKRLHQLYAIDNHKKQLEATNETNTI